MTEALTFENLAIKLSIPYLYIESLKFDHEVNQHGTMIFGVILEEKTAREALNRSFSEESAELFHKQTNQRLFSGTLANVTIKVRDNVWHLQAQVLSATTKLDSKKKKRSFQDVTTTYGAIISDVVSQYPDSHFIAVDSLSHKTKTLTLQYDETDWQLMQRLASKNQTYLVADILDSRPRWWFGLKNGKLIEQVPNKLQVIKRYDAYQESAKNYQGQSYLDSYTIVAFESYTAYELGDYLVENGKRYDIFKFTAEIRDGLLVYTYQAVPKEGLKHRLSTKQDLVGLTLSGAVIDIKGKYVKVHLDIDSKQSKEQACWLPYTTGVSNNAHFMPEIGSEVMVNFPKSTEKDYFVTFATRSKVESYKDGISNPQTKILSNLQGKKISLEEDELSIVSKEGLHLALTDNQNIEFASPTEIKLQAAGKLSFSSSGKISVTGDQGITLQGRDTSSISIANNVQLFSPDLQYTGGSGVKAEHKAFEGRKNVTKKRKSTLELQPIQSLDALKTTSQALSMISILTHSNKVEGSLKLRAASKFINSLALNCREKSISKNDKSNGTKSKESTTAKYRAKLKTNQTKLQFSGLLKSSSLKVQSIKPNGNRALTRISPTILQKLDVSKPKIGQTISAIAKIVRNPAFPQIKTPKKIWTPQSLLSREEFSKSSAIATETTSTLSSNTAQSKLSAPATKLKHKQSINGNGGSGGGGFGVINKGAASAISPTKFMAARTNRDIKAANQAVTNQLKFSINQLQLKLSQHNSAVLSNYKFLTNFGSLQTKSNKQSKLPARIGNLDFISSHKISKELISKVSTVNLKKELRHFGFDPVDLISGAYSFYHSDFKTQAQQGIDWYWEWDSASYLVGSLGNRITFAYDSSLEYLPDESVMVYADTMGRRYVLPLVFDGDSYRDTKNQIIIENKQEVYSVKKIVDKVTYYFSQSSSLPTLYLLTEIRDDNDFTTQLTYDARDYLMCITDSNQASFTVKYNELGLISQVTHNQKILVQYHYTADGNLASVTDELAEKIEFTYDNYLMTKRRDKNGICFHWRYDEDERVVHTWGDGHVIEGWIAYYPDKGYNIVTNSKGSDTRYYYDETGLVSQIAYGDGRKKRFAYNENYNLIQRIEPDNQRITYVYDELGQLIELNFSDGTSEKYRYDENGVMTHLVDRLGKETIYSFDDSGQLISSTYDKKSVFEGQYNAQKLLTHVTIDTESNEMSYDAFGRKIRQVSQNGEVLEWQYDSLGNCIQQIEQKGTHTEIYTYHYDIKNRLIETRLNARFHESYRYDVHDNVLSYEKDNQILTLTYDKLDKVTSILVADDKFEFSYNLDGQLILALKNRKQIYKAERNEHGQIIAETVNQDFRKLFEYDDCGRVEKVIDVDNSWFQVVYDENSNVFEVRNSDGTWELYDYDSFGNVIMARNFASKIVLNYDESLNLIEEQVYLSKNKKPSTLISYEYTKENKLSSIKIDDVLDDIRIFEGEQKQRQVSLINGEELIFSEIQYENETYEKVVERQIDELTMISRYGTTDKLFKKQVSTPYFKQDLVYGYSNVGGKNRLTEKQDIRNRKIKSYDYDGYGNLVQERENNKILYSRTMNEEQTNFKSHPNQQENSYGAVIKSDDVSYDYDQQGRVIRRQQGTEQSLLKYYNSGLLESIETESEKLLFHYDCFGRLLDYGTENSAVRYVWAGNDISLEINTSSHQAPELIQWVTDFNSHQLLARVTVEKAEYFSQGLGGTIENVIDDSGRNEDVQSSSIFANIKTKVSSGIISRQGLKKIQNSDLYYNRFRFIDENSQSFIQRSPLANFILIGKEYLYLDNAMEKLSYDGVSEESYYDFSFIGKYGLGATTIIKKVLIKDENYLMKPIRAHSKVVLRPQINNKNELLKGLEDFGIQRLGDILENNLAQRVEIFLSKNKFVRPVSLPTDSLAMW
ncbi:hypothetical protein RyT2_18320 [Pseudolactococcus yaeyamensis]